MRHTIETLLRAVAPAGTLKSPARGRVKLPHLTAAGRWMITRFDVPWQGVRRIPSVSSSCRRT